MSSIPTKEDLSLLIKADCHRGSDSLTKKMAPYVFKKSEDGRSYIFDLYKTWQKIHAAALLLAAVRQPSDICLAASTNWAQRAIFKFAQYTGAFSVSGRFTPGTLTNQVCRKFREPSVLVVCDPKLDFQPIKEASYVNIPVIACCDTDSPLEYIDLAIPCNNKSKLSVAAIFYLLCREVNRMKGSVTIDKPFDIPIDLFIFKSTEEFTKLIESDNLKRKKEQEAAKELGEQPNDDNPPALTSQEDKPAAAEEEPQDGQSRPAYDQMGASIRADDVQPADSAGAPEKPSEAAEDAPAPEIPAGGALPPFPYYPNMAPFAYYPQQAFPRGGREQPGAEGGRFAFPPPVAGQAGSELPQYAYPPPVYMPGRFPGYPAGYERGAPPPGRMSGQGEEMKREGANQSSQMGYTPQGGYYYYPPFQSQGQMYPPYGQRLPPQEDPNQKRNEKK